ncbi:MAG: CRISPR-associated endonuclease Cas3'' [Deltaproteobacteria bacterium]|nr:CRISPR-associated endonuclease Cas3'' [Deltaproteobacteria bacterium]
MTKEKTRLWIKDIKENDRIHDLYLVKLKKRGVTRNGTPFLSLRLADKTGEVEAKLWERVDTLSPLFKEGDVLEVKGRAGTYRDEIQLTLSDLAVPGEVKDRTIFLESSPRDTGEMMKALKEILKTLGNGHLRGLVDRFLSDRDFLALFKEAPAAKGFHHAYLGGLLEHTLSVCRLARVVSDHYEELDGELLLAGAFLHDVGKVREFHFDRKIDYTGEGRLLGHLVLGVAMVEEKLSAMRGFPEETALKLKHMILSHHGEYEFGSPRRPKFLEAFVLHIIDDLDAKVKGISHFMERDRREGAWTEFNPIFERYLLKGALTEELDREFSEAAAPMDEGKQKVLFSSLMHEQATGADREGGGEGSPGTS